MNLVIGLGLFVVVGIGVFILIKINESPARHHVLSEEDRRNQDE